MARGFDDGSSQYLYSANAVISAYPFTMAAWCYSDDNANLQTVLSVGDTATTNNYWRIVMAGNYANDPFHLWAVNGGAPVIASTSPSGYSINTWHHIIGVGASSTDRRIYIDGGSEGQETTNITPTGIDEVAIGSTAKAAHGNYMSGNIAEAAIWNVALNASERVALSKGYSPLLIRPDGLVFYVPFIRSNDKDIIGGLSLTANGTPTVTVHPRVFYPSMPILGKSSAAEEAVEEMIIKSKLIRSNQIPIHQLQL